MVQYDNIEKDILSLYNNSNCPEYIIKSLLFRKQGKLVVAKNSAMIIWGPCIFIGGKFSQTISGELKNILSNSETLYYIGLPDGEWKTYIDYTFPHGLTARQLNLYQANLTKEVNSHANNNKYIEPISAAWFERNLPNSQLIIEQLYSYTTREDFLLNGYGLALVIDDEVCGYCLSEYSVDNNCGINIEIDEKYRGLGYAKAMTEQFLCYSKSNSWDVFWGCLSDNIPSNKTAISSGFTLYSKKHYFEWKKI